MKRFITSILFVTIFSIGIASLVEKVRATFSLDEKAIELIKKSRAAIGGDSNIKKVKRMEIAGNTNHFFKSNSSKTPEKGKLEIRFELPDRFSKSVFIGNPHSIDSPFTSEKNVWKKKPDGKLHKFKSKKDKEKNVFVIKKGTDGNFVWKSGDTKNIKVEDDNVFIKHGDGKVEKIKKSDADNVFILEDKKRGEIEEVRIHGKDKGLHKGKSVWKEKDGNVFLVEKRKGSGMWKTKNGKNVVIDEIHADSDKKHNVEFLRTTISLLMTSPAGLDVNYKYAGKGSVDNKSSNIIEVESKGSKFKLFLDASTNLPLMISFKVNSRNIFIHEKKSEEGTENKLVELKKHLANGEKVEYQVKFSDFRKVDNLLLPHTWAKMINGKKTSVTKITRYKINSKTLTSTFNTKPIEFRKKNT